MRQFSAVRALAALLAIVMVAAACSDDAGEPALGADDTSSASTTTSSTPDVSDVRTGGELIVGLTRETDTYLPSAGSFSEAGIQVAYTLFDPIAQRGADGQIHPFAAESIEPNADATEWTVRLRDGLVFHDGTDLTADVMQRIFDEYLTGETSVLAGDLAQVAEFRIDDEMTFTYVLDEPNAAFADLLVGPIGWPFSVEACLAAGDACGEQPVGTGPFRFVSWTRDSELVVERNPDYWRTDTSGNALPYLERIVFRPLPDQSTAFLSVRSGTTHAGSTFVADTIRQARDADDVESYEWTGNGGGVTLFNVLEPPLDDRRVRNALHLAASQEDVIALLGGDGIVAPKTQLYASDSAWYSEDAARAWPTYDPASAQALLDEYVDDPDRSDGRPPGAPITLTFQAAPDPALMTVAQYYQDVWREIGAEVELTSVDQAVLISNVVGSSDSDPPFAGNYQVSIFRAGGENDPYTVLSRMLGEPSTQPGNFTNYTSADIQANLDILRTSTDFAERFAASESIMVELAEEMPMLWRGAVVSAVYAAPRVRNVAGWTIPGSDGSDPIPGAGVANAQPHWSHTWLADS